MGQRLHLHGAAPCQPQSSPGRCWSVALPRPHGANRLLSPETMSAGEQMFFLGAPVAHVVQYEQHLRDLRHEQATRRLVRTRGPHNLVRGLTGPPPLCTAGAD